MSEIALRPRSGTELLDAAFQLLRDNFKLFFIVALAAFVPIMIIEVAVAVDPTGLAALMNMLVSAVFEPLATAAIIVVASERYMGRDVTPGEALGRVWARIGTVVATAIIFNIFVAVGTVLLIIPGIYLATRFFAMMPAVVIEGYNSSTSQKRSTQLTEGSRMRILGLFVVSYLIFVILLVMATGTAGALFGEVAGVVVARVLMAGIYPFIGIVTTLLYYDLRIRNEGLDLDIMMAQEAAARPATA
jgi:hypothetical protein